MTSINRRVARSWFSNWPPYTMEYPAGKSTSPSIFCLHLRDKASQVSPSHVGHDDDPALAFFAIDDLSAARDT